MKSIPEIVESVDKLVESLKARNNEFEEEHSVEPLPPSQYEILETTLVQKCLEVRLRGLKATNQ